MKIQKLFAMVLSVLMVCTMFAGCGADSGTENWNRETDSLLAFPFGCTVEKAEQLLGLTQDNIADPGEFSTGSGRQNRFVTYALPENHIEDFDFIRLTEERYENDAGTQTALGVTNVTIGYRHYVEQDGEMVPAESTEAQAQTSKRYYDQQVERCKDSYTAHLKTNFGAKTVDVVALGQWTEKKYKTIGNLPLPEYDYDTFQNQYPLAVITYSKTQVEVNGMYSVYAEKGLK